MAWESFKLAGPPISAKNIGTWVYEQFRQLAASLQALPLAADVTTTELADATSPINTVGKHAGRQVYNTTTGLPLWASGGGATATWNDAAGTTQHTPA